MTAARDRTAVAHSAEQLAGDGMNERTIRMVQMLSRSTGSFSLADLAKRFGVTERTVRNDIAELNHTLRELSLGELELGPRGVVEAPPGFSEAEKILPIAAASEYRLGAEERRATEAAMLAAIPGHLTTGAIAQALSVSRPTVVKDLDEVRKTMGAMGLSVESKPGQGVRASGPESARRLLIVRHFDNPTALAGWAPDHVARELGRIGGIARSVLEDRGRFHGLELPDGSFRRAESALVVGVLRSGHGCPLEPLGDAFLGCARRQVGRFERDVVRAMSELCSVPMGEDDALFMAAVAHTYRFGPDASPDDEAEGVARRLLASVSRDLGVDLTGDEELLSALADHLSSHLLAGTPAREGDALFEEVAEGRPEVCSAVARTMSSLARGTGREPSHAEVASVTMYVCAALERRRAAGAPPRVIVVCDLGTGAMRLLVEEICGHFAVQLVGTMFAHDVELLEGGEADLVISTVSLACPIDTVVVQPLMDDGDYTAVRRALDAVRTRALVSGFGCG